MEDVTDIGFRLLCKRYGAAMVYTEFVSAEALVRNVNSTVKKLTISDEERPVGIQIYGRDVEAMVEAARIVEEAHPDVIDLNFGCPVKKVAGKGAGAGMLQNIPLLLEITREVVKAVNVPVTVKTRLGWNSEQLIITDLAEQLQDCGIQALTIHGRTRAQMYTGEADWTLIGEVKRNPRIHIPIIGNGDIHSLDEADAAFERYGVDGVMIGRATFGCPWIFSRQELSLDEKIDVLKEQLHINVERIDEYRGILHTRRHLAASPVFKSIPNFRQTRIAMLRATKVDELLRIIDEAKELVRKTSLMLMAVLLTTVCGCTEEQMEVENAAYYWRTEWRTDSVERAFLSQYHINKVYCRYFDVVMDSLGPKPNATISFDEPVPEGLELIPTVYITEDCMHQTHEGLARKLVKRLMQMNETNDIEGVREIQIDCDYTSKSRSTYYAFLDEVRSEAQKHHLRLSTTIRLHQLSMPAPPADYGVLMIYNTGDPRKFMERNPILDLRDVQPYLHRLGGYPLPLAAAYPVYRWQRNINGVRVEHEVAADEILQVKKAVEKQRPQLSRTILTYHLDNENINRYQPETYEAIYHH